MATDKEIEAALAAWKKDWLEGPPEQNEISAMRAALTAAEQVRASEPNDSERFHAALTAIAAMPDEDDEWDGRDKFHELRAIAQNALAIVHD